MGASGHVSAAARGAAAVIWRLITAGASSDDASAAVGVNRRTGRRWFTEAGGMPPGDLAERTGRYLSFVEREEIALGRAAGLSMREIARQLGRAPSTISREIARGCLNRRPRGRYRASLAQARADARARRRSRPSWCCIRGCAPGSPTSSSTCSGAPSRSPAGCGRSSPTMESMRISHEAIYQSLYVQGRGALRRELAVCLRTGRALRKPRRRADRPPGADQGQGDDQRTPRRGRRPGGSRTLGGRPGGRQERPDRRSEPSSSGPPGSSCCCTCPMGSIPKASTTPSPTRSPPCRPRCAAR